jgi:hypothetical protein
MKKKPICQHGSGKVPEFCSPIRQLNHKNQR